MSYTFGNKSNSLDTKSNYLGKYKVRKTFLLLGGYFIRGVIFDVKVLEEYPEVIIQDRYDVPVEARILQYTFDLISPYIENSESQGRVKDDHEGMIYNPITDTWSWF